MSTRNRLFAAATDYGRWAICDCDKDKPTLDECVTELEAAAIAYAMTPRSTRTDPPKIGQEVMLWWERENKWQPVVWFQDHSFDYKWWLPMPPKPEEK